MTTFKLFSNHIRTGFILLAITEGLIFFGAVFLATAIRFNTTDFFSPEAIAQIGNTSYKAAIFTFCHMLSMTALGQYQTEQFRGNFGSLQMVSRVMVSMLLVSVVLVILFYIIPSSEMGRGVASLAFLISFTCVITVRQIFFHLVDGNIFISKVLVFGVGKTAASLLDGVNDREKPTGYQIKGFISTPNQEAIVPEHMILQLGDSLLRQSRELGVHEIVLALDDRRQKFPTQHLLDCKLAGIRVIDPVSFLEREKGKVILELMNPSWMIYSEGFTVSKFKSFLSRSFDVMASLLILLLTFPILLITAFLIALESGFKEPVFYKQERVGQNGKLFNLIKFRSMHVNAETSGAQWATENDARITLVGKFIRKTRIDELPQILNILKGDMRLVGPRPERPEFVDKLSKSITMYSQRHTVKPGLAGWAQLKYPYGASDEDAYEKLQYDLFYIKNGNLVMDFFILLQTLEIVLFGKGAR